MPAIRPDQRWGKVIYGPAGGSGAPVPLVQHRCRSAADSPAHVCKLHDDHDGDHRCICSMSWPAKRPA